MRDTPLLVVTPPSLFHQFLRLLKIKPLVVIQYVLCSLRIGMAWVTISWDMSNKTKLSKIKDLGLLVG